MAERIFFKSTPDAEAAYEEIPVEFEYFSGFARVQKQKSVESMHKAIKEKHPDLRVLEISTASEENVGYDLSAHNLMLEDEKGDRYPVENIFQSSKVFLLKGGPYRELLSIPAKEVKKKLKMKLKEISNLVKLESFNYQSEIWPLEPKSIFYDWLYINAIKQTPELGEKLLEYDAFTDINFNHKKSINCQARAAAIFVALEKREQLDKVDTKEHFTELSKTIYLPDAQTSMFKK
jgi:type I restriction enzyme M protein